MSDGPQLSIPENRTEDYSAVGWLKIALATTITIAALMWGGDLFRRIGVNLLTQQFVAAMLALAIALAFLHFPVVRGNARTNVPWYDWLFAMVGLAAGLYLAVNIPHLVDLILMRPADGVVAGSVLIVLSVEAL